MPDLEQRLLVHGQNLDQQAPPVGLDELEQRMTEDVTDQVVGFESVPSRPLTWRRGVLIGVAAAFVLLMGFLLPILFNGSNPQAPADTSPSSTSPSSTDTADLAVAQAFMTAWVTGDGEAAARLFNPSGTYGAGIFSPKLLPELHDFYRAVGWEFHDLGCKADPVQVPDRKFYAECAFTGENDMSHALGWPPVRDTFRIVLDDGGIDLATERYGFDAYRDLWFEFKDWVAAHHADDLKGMFIYANQGWPGVRFATMDPPFEALNAYPLLNEHSIALWAEYADDFVTSPEALSQASQDLQVARFVAQTVETCKAADAEFLAEVTGLMQLETQNFQQFYVGFPDLHSVAVWYDTRARHADTVIGALQARPAPAEIEYRLDNLVELMLDENDLTRQVAAAAEAGDQDLVDTLIAQRIDATHAKDGLAFKIGYAMWVCPVSSGGA